MRELNMLRDELDRKLFWVVEDWLKQGRRHHSLVYCHSKIHKSLNIDRLKRPTVNLIEAPEVEEETDESDPSCA